MKQEVKSYYTKNNSNRFQKRGSIYNIDSEYKDLLDTFIELIPPSEKPLIDVGCGTGRDTSYFTSHSYDCISLDISNEQLQYVQNNLKIQADMFHIPIQPESVIGIWIPNSIFFLPLDQMFSTLLKLKSCLDTKGIMCIGFKIGQIIERKEMNRYGLNTPYTQLTTDYAKELLTNLQMKTLCTNTNTSSDGSVTFYNQILQKTK